METAPSLISCMVRTTSGLVGWSELTPTQLTGFGDPISEVTVFEDLGGEIRHHNVVYGDVASVSTDHSELLAHGW